MEIGTLLLFALVFALVAVYPGWSYSSNWGYIPGILVAVLLALLLILLVTGIV